MSIVTNVLTTCAVFIFRVKAAMLLVVGQLSRDVITLL